jgi:hypothetical protein
MWICDKSLEPMCQPTSLITLCTWQRDDHIEDDIDEIITEVKVITPALSKDELDALALELASDLADEYGGFLRGVEKPPWLIMSSAGIRDNAAAL